MATQKTKKQIQVVKAPLKVVQSQKGKFIYKPLKSIILICVCGNKYVSTRERQKTCLRCIQALLPNRA